MTSGPPIGGPLALSIAKLPQEPARLPRIARAHARCSRPRPRGHPDRAPGLTHDGRARRERRLRDRTRRRAPPRLNDRGVMASAGGSCQEMGPAVDFAVHASPPLHHSARTPQSSPARNALSCHPPEKRLPPRAHATAIAFAQAATVDRTRSAWPWLYLAERPRVFPLWERWPASIRSSRDGGRCR
jgi:hypothetical protein